MFDEQGFNVMETDPFSWWFPYIVAVIVGVVTIIREYAGGIECPSKQLLKNKLVLITGGSGGIAFEVALELVKRDAIVILGCKSVRKGQKARKEILKIVPTAMILIRELDLSCVASVRRFADDYTNRKLDILINNAGISERSFYLTPDGYEIHLATNYLGHFYLTHLLTERLTGPGGISRVINVVDKVHKKVSLRLEDLNITTNWSYQEAYAHSKLCLVLMARHMAKLYSDHRVNIYAVSPGWVRNTGFLRNSPTTTNTFLKLWFYPLFWLFYKTPKQGAQSIIYAAVDPNLNKTSGVLISNCEVERTKKDRALDRLAEDLYLKTCDMLPVQPIRKRPEY